MKYIIRAAFLFLAFGLAVGTKHAESQETIDGRRNAGCTLMSKSAAESQAERSGIIVETGADYDAR